MSETSDNDEPEYEAKDYVTYVVYANATPSGPELSVPTKHATFPEDVKDALLTLVDFSALDVSHAEDGEHVAHIYATPDDSAILGFEIQPSFDPRK